MWKIVYKDDCVIEVLARSSKNGAYGQNTLCSFCLAHLRRIPLKVRAISAKINY